MDNKKIAIIISTYRREDGKTPDFLYRALSSIKKQTYQNYKIFLIGDKYEKSEEVLEIIKKLSIKNIYFENLPIAKERDKYKGNVLWSYGGVNAMNHAIKKALNENFDYMCHLDHDDWWYENHLELINECIIKTNSDWICTKSTWGNDKIFLPLINSLEKYIEFLPRSSKLIHSSVCMNFKKIPLFYRDLFEENGNVGLPADADLWERTRLVITQNNFKSTFINELTCRHDEEGYERSRK